MIKVDKKSRIAFKCNKCGNCCKNNKGIFIGCDDYCRIVNSNLFNKNAAGAFLKTLTIQKKYNDLDYKKSITELTKIAVYLYGENLSKEAMTEFLSMQRYVVDQKFVLQNCPFYLNNMCAIYQDRPLFCRIYPLFRDDSGDIYIDETHPGVKDFKIAVDEYLRSQGVSDLSKSFDDNVFSKISTLEAEDRIPIIDQESELKIGKILIKEVTKDNIDRVLKNKPRPKLKKQKYDGDDENAANSNEKYREEKNCL